MDTNPATYNIDLAIRYTNTIVAPTLFLDWI